MTKDRTVIAALLTSALLVVPAQAGWKTKFLTGVAVGLGGYILANSAANAASNTWGDFLDSMRGMWELKKLGDEITDYSDRTHALASALGRQIGIVSVWQACSIAQGMDRKDFWEAHLVDTIVFPSQIALDQEIVRCCDPSVIYAAPAADILSAILPTDLLSRLIPDSKNLGRSVMPIEMALSLAEQVYTEPVFEKVKATIVANAEASSEYRQCKDLVRMVSELD